MYRLVIFLVGVTRENSKEIFALQVDKPWLMVSSGFLVRTLRDHLGH